ncbi:MAG: ATP-binding cassette domain-containing protein [Mariprofundaceae bacterium]|nr:ATP-binding cassette domain-containing protein [Mariprofundaceae bacterium]
MNTSCPTVNKTDTPKIRVCHVSKSFGDKDILKEVSLEIAKGESMVVIGLSGTGKSVLMNCILGLLKPDSGQILVDGEDWCTLPEGEQLERMQRIGMVFQSSALFDSLPVWKNVAFALLQRGMPQAQARERANEVLELVGLPGTGNMMPAELSGGMTKRAGLARAICHRPQMVFYDEPLAGLDPVMSDAITQLMRRLHEEFKVTSLTIAHNMNLARHFADRIAMLLDGKIYRILTPEELDSSDDPVVRQFVDGRAEGPIHVLEASMAELNKEKTI